jgi:transitional endoplasmic reticulum ATPase
VNDSIAPLREALAFSPDNVPLRLHLARVLLGAGRPREARQEATEVLRRSADLVDAHKVAHDACAALDDASGRAEHGWQARTLLGDVELVAVAHALLAGGRRTEAQEVYDLARARDGSLRDLSLERALRLQLVPPSVVETAPAPSPTEPHAAPARARPDITFEDVGGLEALKERLRLDVVYPMQRPDLYKAYGKKMGGGVLLYGPPVCGKTHLARAAAGECGATFIPVEIQQVLDMWLGESEKHLHQIFERARDEAPSILFFDEIEAIGASRHQLRHGPGRRMVNQLLTELDGAGASNERVLVLGATNAPWDVDPALRRPGRFDRVVFVPPPDLAGREAVLRIAFRERPTENLDLARIAARTERFSGADLTHLAEVASERALADALKSGTLRPVTGSDVLAVLDRVRPTTAEWLATAKRYVAYANEAGLYDDVAAYLAATERR